MDNPILTQTRTIVEIDLVRDGLHIFYNRREDGRTVIAARPTSRERAQEIYQANAGEPQQRTIGAVDFSPEPRTWSWTVKVVEEAA